jgi:hypothetical protein
MKLVQKMFVKQEGRHLHHLPYFRKYKPVLVIAFKKSRSIQNYIMTIELRLLLLTISKG